MSHLHKLNRKPKAEQFYRAVVKAASPLLFTMFTRNILPNLFFFPNWSNCYFHFASLITKLLLYTRYFLLTQIMGSEIKQHLQLKALCIFFLKYKIQILYIPSWIHFSCDAPVKCIACGLPRISNHLAAFPKNWQHRIAFKTQTTV